MGDMKLSHFNALLATSCLEFLPINLRARQLRVGLAIVMD